MNRKQYCPKGHDTFVTGRSPSYTCHVCRREAEREYQKKRRGVMRLTLDEIAAILKAQEYKCALCGIPLENNQTIDHDLKTKKIRGIIHSGCNTLVGFLEHSAKAEGRGVSEWRTVDICGLTGWIGEAKVSKDQRLRRARALEGLLVANGERGTDASGVGIIHASGRQSIYKRAISSYRMVDHEELHTLVRAPDATMAIGHTRWGTMGKNTDRNAHPFSENNVLGAHNGIIWNHNELSSVITGGYKPLQVDSQISFRLLSEIDSDPKKIVKALPLMKGQLALTWYDQRNEGALWVFRHSNPISMAIVDGGQCAFWSSEYNHLATVLQAVYGSKWSPVAIKEDTLYRFTWDGELKSELWDVDMPSIVISRAPALYGQGAAKQLTTGATSSTAHMSKKQKKKARKAARQRTVTIEDFPVRANPLFDDNEFCDVCKTNIDYMDDDGTFLSVGEGYMICGACHRWWKSTGSDMYNGDLEEAIALMDANGSYHDLANASEYGHMRFGG